MSRTAEFFHRYASDFSAIYGNQDIFPQNIINKLFRESMLLRFQKTMKECQPITGMTVIDVGCGPGHYTVALAKIGAKSIIGIDFAPGMIELANQRAQDSGVQDKCTFIQGDISTYLFPEKFDYSIVMGVMDYIGDPKETIAKVLSLTRSKALFSFPKDGGFLAWQRKVRYRSKCPIYMYTEEQLQDLFVNSHSSEVQIERMKRDYFVTVII